MVFAVSSERANSDLEHEYIEFASGETYRLERGFLLHKMSEEDLLNLMCFGIDFRLKLTKINQSFHGE